MGCYRHAQNLLKFNLLLCLRQVHHLTLLALLIMLGTAFTARANTVLYLESNHFKLEVMPVNAGSNPDYRVRMTLLNTNLLNVVRMAGMIKLQTNLPASQITTQALVSNFESISYKVTLADDDPQTLNLLFDIKSVQGWNTQEIVLEWFFSAQAGATIQQSNALLDGIVAVEILEGCKTLPPAGPPVLSEVYQEEIVAATQPTDPCLPSLALDDLRVFPNPTAGPLRLQFGEGLPLPDHVRICTPTGQVVLESPVHSSQHDLDLQALPPGTYLVYGMQGGKTLYTRRVNKY
jgi:hypothetical protein